MTAGLLDVVGDAAVNPVVLELSPGVVSGTLGSVALCCTLKAVVFLF